MFELKNTDSSLSDLRRKVASIIPRNARSSRNLALDFLICNAVLVVCTLIGILFRWFGFSDATIISVYILGVLLSAVVATSYITNFIVSFEAMIVFNFFFTEPLFTLHAYDAEYPVTWICSTTSSYSPRIPRGQAVLRFTAVSMRRGSFSVRIPWRGSFA